MKKSLLAVGLVLASLAAWCWLVKPELAIIFIGATLWHELGHLLKARYLGYEVSGIFFIPLMGAVTLTEKPDNKIDEARIALAGPYAGLVLACILWWINSMFFNYNSITLGIQWICIVNTINLIPLLSTDGYRVLKAIRYSLKNPADWRSMFRSEIEAIAFDCGLTLVVLGAILYATLKVPIDIRSYLR